MSGAARLFLWLTAGVYALFFVVEAVLWPQPAVHDLIIAKLNPGLDAPPALQAAVLKALFVNQGFYNLALALGAGFAAWRDDGAAGRALAMFTCLAAIGAGVTLVVTTEAYALGAAQIIIPAIALLLVWRRPRPH